MNSIELELSGLRTDVSEGMSAASTDKEGKEKVLEAKIEDLNDRLRLGMNKLQVGGSDLAYKIEVDRESAFLRSDRNR